MPPARASAWSSTNAETSRASISCRPRAGSPGATTRPPAAILVSHHGSWPRLSCGPTIEPAARDQAGARPVGLLDRQLAAAFVNGQFPEVCRVPVLVRPPGQVAADSSFAVVFQAR